MIIITIPNNTHSGNVQNMNGSGAGQWTKEPPPPGAIPFPVSCDLPCLGRVYDFSEIRADCRWVLCGREKVSLHRTEGWHNGGYNENWRPGAYETTRSLQDRYLYDLASPTYYLPASTPAGKYYLMPPTVFANNLSMVGKGLIDYLIVSANAYRDSFGGCWSACDAPPYASQAHWEAKQQEINAAWSAEAGQRWVEFYYCDWYYEVISEEKRTPLNGNLLPIYAGCLSAVSTLCSGAAGLSMSSAIAEMVALMWASGAAASSGGRVLKNDQQEDSVDLFGVW